MEPNETLNDLVYPDIPNVMKLSTDVPPVQILSEHFSNHNWPINGGWGYSKEDAVVLEVDNSRKGINLEYRYLEYRTYEEAIIFRPKGQKLAGFRFERISQRLEGGEGGKHYDVITMKVSAYKEEDFKSLKEDWESNNGFQDDPLKGMEHIMLAKSKLIEYEIIGWFDITRFF